MPQRTVKRKRRKSGKAYRSRAISRLKRAARARLRAKRGARR